VLSDTDELRNGSAFPTVLACNNLGHLRPKRIRADVLLWSNGDYATDLGSLEGSIKTMEYTRDICSEQFPDMQKQLGDAYNNWRQRYKPFLQEIALRFSLLMIEAAKENNTSLVSNAEYFSNTFAQSKLALRNMFSKDGPEKFRAICEHYPISLEGEIGNIEKHYPEQVETIRKVKIK
jgi:hypothetical protein